MNKHINPSMYHFHVKMGNHLKKLDIFEIKVHTFQIESSFLQVKPETPNSSWNNFLLKENLV